MSGSKVSWSAIATCAALTAAAIWFVIRGDWTFALVAELAAIMLLWTAVDMSGGSHD